MFSIIQEIRRGKIEDLLRQDMTPFEMFIHLIGYLTIRKYRIKPPRLIYRKPKRHRVISAAMLFEESYNTLIKLISIYTTKSYEDVYLDFIKTQFSETEIEVEYYLEYNNNIIINRHDCGKTIDRDIFTNLIHNYYESLDEIDSLIQMYPKEDWAYAILEYFEDELILTLLTILKLIDIGDYLIEYNIWYREIVPSYVILSKSIEKYTIEDFTPDSIYTEIITSYIILYIFNPRYFYSV
jgi:hypothetical protein